MGAIVTTVKNVEPVGKRTRASGTLHLSASYTTGGDTVDPLALGLATVEELCVYNPHNAGGTAVSSVTTAVVRSTLPQRTAKFGGSGSIAVQVFSAESTEASGDLSAIIWDYWAMGV